MYLCPNGTLTQRTCLAASTITQTMPAGTRALYISSDQNLRVTVDGSTAPSATQGLVVFAGDIVLLYTNSQYVVRLFNTSSVEANISIQPLAGT